MIADLTGYGVRAPTGNPGRAVRTGGVPVIADPMVGLTAYWKFDTAAAGTTPDATGNGNALSLVGPTPAIQTTTFKLGGHAYGSQSFNDGLQRIESTQLIPGPTGFTMQNWCNRSVNVGTFTIMGRCRTASGGSGDLDFRMGAYSGVALHRIFEFAVKNAAGNRYTVPFLGVTMEEAVWYHVCCGYDAALQQIWIQVNGAQRQVLNGVSDVRVTIPNFTMVNDMDMSSAASCCAEEAGFWNRSLSDGEVVMLYNAGNARAYPFVGTVPPSSPSISLGNGWSLQVQANGGAVPSVASASAVDSFINGCITDQIWSNILAANVIAPDSIIAALTPINGPSRLWVNQGFVIGDLTVAGLKGDGGSKYADTQFVSSAGGQTSTSAGLVVYVSVDDATSTQCELGSKGALSQAAFSLYAHSSGSPFTIFNCWRYSNAGFDGVAGWTPPTPPTGFYSGQRTAANACSVYFANSTVAHSALATAGGTQVGSVETAVSLLAWCQVGPADFSKKRISFIAMTVGLTSAKSALLYARVQALRVALGGGYV